MRKIRVCHHSKTIGYAGTDRTAQLFVKYLNQLPDIEAFLVYRENDDTSRLEECKKTIGEEFLIPYQHKHAHKAPSPYLPEYSNLSEVLAALKPDIFHIHRSGYPEWPGMKSVCPTAKFVETNIFAGVDRSPDIDLHIYISNFIAVRAKMLGGSPGPIVMNPTEKPTGTDNARKFMLKKTGLPDDAILLGRVGRPDNFDPIALKAFARIQHDCPNVYYLVVNPCQAWRDGINRFRIEPGRVIFLPKIVNDLELSQFYSAPHIYAHARVDGECQPCNLNEAMYHGKPIVTHVADTYQGHVEQIQWSGGGLVAGHRNDEEYANHLRSLIEDMPRRIKLGALGYRWASNNVDAEVVTKKLAKIYEGVLS